MYSSHYCRHHTTFIYCAPISHFLQPPISLYVPGPSCNMITTLLRPIENILKNWQQKVF